MNIVLSFLLVPNDGGSRTAWSEYSKMKDLDMVYAGSSYCQEAFNPIAIDELLGTDSYNFGTSGQVLNQSYIAIKDAIETRHISCAVLGIGIVTMEQTQQVNAEVSFLYAKMQYEGAADAASDYADFIFAKNNINTVNSINVFFPWVYNHVQLNPGTIRDNVLKKREGVQLPENYMGKGYCYDGVVLDEEHIGTDTTKSLYSNVFAPEAFDELSNIIQLCRENNVDLIVICTPHPWFDVAAYGTEYLDKVDAWQSFFAENETDFYDFNMAKPSLFASKLEYFRDYEHLNTDGANAFAASFAEVCKMRQNGEKEAIGKLFYTDEEFSQLLKQQ